MTPKQSAIKLKQLHTRAGKIVVEIAKKLEDLCEVCDQVGALVDDTPAKPAIDAGRNGAAKKKPAARKR